MNRRDAIKYTSLMTGTAVFPTVLSSLFASCNSNGVKNELDYHPEFFELEDFKMVTSLVDIILPKTDSPSASELGVHRIIDHMVGATYRPDERESFETRFNLFAKYLKTKGFKEGSDEEKLDILIGIINSNDPALNEVKSGFQEFRQLTVAFYLSTEEIAENFLNYLPVPGPYQACINVEEVGNKAWAI
ncbi:MAG: gluconate 2-dehydrogenase subunit 3 family protein [Reichenbachiella sp.]